MTACLDTKRWILGNADSVTNHHSLAGFGISMLQGMGVGVLASSPAYLYMQQHCSLMLFQLIWSFLWDFAQSWANVHDFSNLFSRVTFMVYLV